MLIEIKNYVSGKILHEIEADNFKAALKLLVLREADLRGADLRGANLFGANLREADLRKANLFEANLFGANLFGANLCGANLREADLRTADLCGADLRGANLREADLCGADLCGADLREADLCGADLFGANLLVYITDIWTVYIQTGHIRIGCQYHKANSWRKYHDETIAGMDSEALEWWKRHKIAIFAIHEVLTQRKETT